ncbi:MAG: hypothetical protein AVO33_08640 [delta proteobacterium ML8_F1]|nr:MAG: hypothetical protein AVO33_08640 [delta proteobacterium ML8_F1]
MMYNYEALSRIYDEYMSEYDYAGVLERVLPLFKARGVKRVMDLGCGTGTGSLMLYEAGLSVSALDISPGMLAKAKDKALEKNYRIEFYQGDMKDFELNRTFDAMVSLTDGFNYLLTEEDVRRALRSIRKHLHPGGWLFFDMSTIYKFKEVIGERTFAQTGEDNAYIWENTYRGEDQILAFFITIYQKEKEDLYRRYEEYHEQRGYPVELMAGILDKEGFEVVQITGSGENLESSERLFFLARLRDAGEEI